MEPIRVPAPPKSAFNKHRRVSDLIRAQTDHLKHLELKMSPQQRAQIPQHPITTEEDAALYIAAMTRLLSGQPPIAAVTPIDTARRPATRPGLAIAAAAADPDPEHPQPAPKSPIPTANGTCVEATK